MIYVSLDLETTGLDPEHCQVLEIGAVIEDTTKYHPVHELTHFHRLVDQRHIQGDLFALHMNREILSELAEGKGTHPDLVWGEFYSWLTQVKQHTGQKVYLAGKNIAGFDRQFLPEPIKELTHHRCIDPGSVFIDWEQGKMPGLGELSGTKTKHRALDDARDVIRVLRRAYAPEWSGE